MYPASMGGLFLNTSYSKDPNCVLLQKGKEILEEIKGRSNKFERNASSLHNESMFFSEISQAIDNAERALQAFKRKIC